MDGVSPDDADSSSSSDPGFEHRTRLDLLGVAGGVDMQPDFEAGELIRERRFVLLVLLTDWLLAVIVE
jgi:hypothetical protein